MENKVVKCKGCGQYFTREGKNIKYCPFCKTEYIEVQEKTASSAEASDFAKASTYKSAAKKDKKWTTKTQKESFKIWGKKDS